MEHLFILITMGDMLGVPILPPYYSLASCPTWSRRFHVEETYAAREDLTTAGIESNECKVLSVKCCKDGSRSWLIAFHFPLNYWEVCYSLSKILNSFRTAIHHV